MNETETYGTLKIDPSNWMPSTITFRLNDSEVMVISEDKCVIRGEEIGTAEQAKQIHDFLLKMVEEYRADR